MLDRAGPMVPPLRESFRIWNFCVRHPPSSAARSIIAAETLSFDDSGEEVTPGALAEKRTNLLIIEQGDKLDSSLVTVVGGGKERGLNLKLISNKLNQSGRLGVDERASRAQGSGGRTLRAFQADDRDSLSLGVVVSQHTDSKMRRKGRNSSDGPVQLDQLGDVFASSSIGRDTEFDEAGLHRLCAHGLELRGKGVNVTANHGNTVSRLVCFANLECDKRATISSDPVLATSFDLALPVVAWRELVFAKLLEFVLEIIDSVKDGGVLLKKVGERFCESLGFELLDLAQTARLAFLEVPVDLTDLVRRKLRDTRCAHAVVSCIATLHI
ncbi:hypothetical protein HG530_008915 [Fusarium avenaceum]|nr:hypothetical protein HG530_008915 [Fusarium avenaceum]